MVCRNLRKPDPYERYSPAGATLAFVIILLILFGLCSWLHSKGMLKRTDNTRGISQIQETMYEVLSTIQTET